MYDHIVFVAALVYDNLNTNTITEAYNDLETHTLRVNDSSGWQSTTFSAYFSIDFQLKIITSDHDTSGVNGSNWAAWLKEEGNDILGLNNNNWTNGHGTQEENHGFDMLAGFIDVIGGNAVGISRQ